MHDRALENRNWSEKTDVRKLAEEMERKFAAPIHNNLFLLLRMMSKASAGIWSPVSGITL